MSWQVHGNEKIKRLALKADGHGELAADAILRALAGKPVPLKNLARFKQLSAQRKNKEARQWLRKNSK